MPLSIRPGPGRKRGRNAVVCADQLFAMVRRSSSGSRRGRVRSRNSRDRSRQPRPLQPTPAPRQPAALAAAAALASEAEGAVAEEDVKVQVAQRATRPSTGGARVGPLKEVQG
eukprot:s1126_g5.t1